MSLLRKEERRENTTRDRYMSLADLVFPKAFEKIVCFSLSMSLGRAWLWVMKARVKCFPWAGSIVP